MGRDDEQLPWSGCLGVRLDPPDLAGPYGSSRGEPLLDVTLRRGDAGEPGPRTVWHLTGEVDLPAGGAVEIDQRLTERADGTLHLHGPGGTGGTGDAGGTHLAIDPASSTLTIEGGADADRHPQVAWQVVATIGLPLLLHRAGVLLLHASAACRDGEAVLVTGVSGAGKSSLLIGLVDAGWQAISEDLCAIDLRGDRPMVWPGPPWVRRAGEGPVGAAVRFETPDKTAWDLAPWLADGPVPVRSIVVLEPPGGTEVERKVLVKADAVAAVARHAFWLGDPAERAGAVFRPCVRLVGATTVATLRSPIDPGWLGPARTALSG